MTEDQKLIEAKRAAEDAVDCGGAARDPDETIAVHVWVITALLDLADRLEASMRDRDGEDVARLQASTLKIDHLRKQLDRAESEIDALRSLLAEARPLLDAGSALEKPDYSFGKFACHVDLAPDEAPDDCVLNYGVPGDCIYARTASGRVRRSPHTCPYWKRVAPSSAMQTPDEVPGTNPDIGEGEN